MKISHISFSSSGGAGIAAQALHEALLKASIESDMNTLVIDTLKENKFKLKSIALLAFIDNFIIKDLKSKDMLSILRSEKNQLDFSTLNDSDILHLHWTPGFVNLDKLFSYANLHSKKIVLTLHDFWFFTGGCHYSNNCTKYEQSCRSCPAAKLVFNQIPSVWLKKKERIFQNIDFAVIAPSSWIADRAQRSSLFSSAKVHVIPNIINSEKFYPIDKAEAKTQFEIEKNSLTIGVCASDLSDPRKGIEELILHLISYNKLENLNITIFAIGKNLSQNIQKRAQANNINLITRSFLPESIELNTAYNSLDFFIHNAFEDNLPNVIREVMELGIPIIARNAGGIPDMIKEYKAGYTYTRYDELEAIINLISFNDVNHSEKGLNPQNLNILEDHLKIYSELLS